MKNVAILAMLAALTTSSAFAQGIGWALSASDTDPYMNTAPPGAPGTLTTLWLHYECNLTPPAGPGVGMTAMEADLSVTPLAPIAVLNGFLNAGTSNEKLLLVVGGCPPAPVVAGSLLFLNDGQGFSVCLVPSADNGFNLTVDCGGTGWDNGVWGFSSTTAPPCHIDNCSFVDSVRDDTWGGIKTLYR